MKSTRRTQPYRKGSLLRQPSPALKAMKRGKNFYGQNPQDLPRLATKRANANRRRRRRT